MRLSIIIVNFKTRELLKECLNSIKENFEYEIIVIDNNSQDGSVEEIESWKSIKSGEDAGSQLKLIENKKNLGFAKAVNQGLKIAQGKYILLLNPDTKLKEGGLKQCLDFLVENPKIGILGCQLLNIDGSVQASFGNFPSLITEFFQATFLYKFFPLGRWIPFGFLSKGLFKRVHFVDWVGGGFMLMRREVVKAVGGLDENFFMYFEDVDFCQRVSNQEWRIIYWPEVRILHYHMQSAKRDIALAWWQEAESLIYYFKKYKKNLFILKVLLYFRAYLQIFVVKYLSILFRVFRIESLSLAGDRERLLSSYRDFLKRLDNFF